MKSLTVAAIVVLRELEPRSRSREPACHRIEPKAAEGENEQAAAWLHGATHFCSTGTGERSNFVTAGHEAVSGQRVFVIGAILAPMR
jgi:hypothetical protein